MAVPQAVDSEAALQEATSAAGVAPAVVEAALVAAVADAGKFCR